MTYRRIAATIVAVAVLAACESVAVPIPAETATASGPDQSASVAPPTGAVAPTNNPDARLRIADLPTVDLGVVDATAVCDPDPGQASAEAGESAIACTDGVARALAVVRAVTPDPLTRLYLRRPACAAVPCTQDELNTATVSVWRGALALDVHLDWRASTVAVPTPAAGAAWPAPADGQVVGSAGPAIDGAPMEVARRDAYPFCGQAELGAPLVVLACFRDAVVSGRPAEMTERRFGTEGGEVLWIYRYAGHGRLIRYAHDRTADADGGVVDSWSREEGAMVLGPTPGHWSFEPWTSEPLGP